MPWDVACGVMYSYRDILQSAQRCANYLGQISGILSRLLRKCAKGMPRRSGATLAIYVLSL